MKKILATILALASVLGLAACSERNLPLTGSTPTSDSASSSDPAQTSDPTTSDEVIENKTFAPIEITGDNVLNSVRIFDTMYTNENQAMFSPLSLNMCLGMLEAGAAGSSKEALDAYLGNTDYAAFASEYMEHAKDFNSAVNNDYQKYKNVFEIANSFWASEQRKFNEDYKQTVGENFAAEIENVDFLKPKKAAKIINDWVNEKTHKMIPTIVREDQLTEDTAAVVVNTVYFESAWSDEWWVTGEKEAFTNADGSTTDTGLMRNGGDSYFENDNATAFSCRYKNGMYFIGILPKKEGDFTLESLDLSSLLKTESYEYDVYARMPKLNFESSFPLTDVLKAAGLDIIFDPDFADFTPMEGDPDNQQFYISEVMQKTKLELDEEGTRAAAVTAAIVADASAAVMPVEREKKEVYLDRPFAFLIYDNEADQIVFMGKVTQLD